MSFEEFELKYPGFRHLIKDRTQISLSELDNVLALLRQKEYKEMCMYIFHDLDILYNTDVFIELYRPLIRKNKINNLLNDTKY
jgi:hypothetical protein